MLLEPQDTLPLDPDLAETLLQHKGRVTFVADSDYVFAGSTGKTKWKDSILADYIKPAAERAKIGNVSWHVFRHSYRALLKRLKTPLEVQKQLMRHADLKTTLEVYGREPGVDEERRTANSEVAKMLLGR